MSRPALAAACGLLVLCPATARLASPQTPLGTSFTYQGRLEESGSPANGTYDFRFILYDAPAGGNQVGPVVTRDNVFVSTGLFTVGVDFGAVFTSQRRFLEVGVRPGASTGTYDVVSGRHELSAAPSALFGASAPWAGVTGKPAGFADGVDNDMLAGMVCSNGQVPKSNGTTWACGADLNTTYTAGPGIQVSGTVISIPASSITAAMIVDNAVGNAEIGDGAVGTSELQSGAVTTVKLASGAVVTSHLADGAVTATKIATSAVGSAQVADGSILGSDIAQNTIGRANLGGVERVLYQQATGCASPGFATLSPICPTIHCNTLLYNTCAGDCGVPGQTVCNNNVVGHLLGVSIP